MSKVTVDVDPRFNVSLTLREAQVVYALLYKLDFEPESEFGKEAAELATALEEAANDAGVGDDFGNVAIDDIGSGDGTVSF